jgi:hypothetical protein
MPARAADVRRIAAIGRIAVRAAGRLSEWNLTQAGQVVATFAIFAGDAHQLMMRVVVSLRLLAATMPMSAITTIAPTMIHVHGTVLVVVVVVVVDESGPVDFCVVVADPGFGAAAELLPAAGPL